MRRVLAFASLVVLAGCVPPSVPAPTPAALAPPPASSDWRDWALTPGTWRYRQDASGSVASYGVSADSAEFTLRCDRAAARLHLSRRGVAPGAMTIRTSSAARTVTAALPANDPLVDAMGYSRSRFIVETTPLPPLVIPAWAEVLRVVEDCRR